MRDDEQGNKPTQDSDRAAILARRKQFIALALSGLTTTAACTDGSEKAGDRKTEQPTKEDPQKQPPQPCLEIRSEPQVCLSVAPPREPDPPQPQSDPEPVPPQVCLKIAQPPEPEEPKPEPKPRPCLKKMPPKSEPG